MKIEDEHFPKNIKDFHNISKKHNISKNYLNYTFSNICNNNKNSV
jgi:uncharacterized protein YozE (UPF0346 family)